MSAPAATVSSSNLLLSLSACVQSTEPVRALSQLARMPVAKQDFAFIEAYTGAVRAVTQNVAKYEPDQTAPYFECVVAPLFEQNRLSPALLEVWGMACLAGCTNAGQNGAPLFVIDIAKRMWAKRVQSVSPRLGTALLEYMP